MAVKALEALAREEHAEANVSPSILSCLRQDACPLLPILLLISLLG